MRTSKRVALLLVSAAGLGVGLIAFPASAAAAAPPVVPTCPPSGAFSLTNPSNSNGGSNSCVSGKVTAVDGSLGTSLENIKLGTRVRSVFSPTTDETNKVIVRYDDAGTINLTGIPTCPPSKLKTTPSAPAPDMNIAQAWAACGPGGGATKNAYLSSGLGASVSGIGSTIPNGGGAIACTMIFKGADNTHVTIYARAPVASTSACNPPATQTGGSATVVFTGTLTTSPTSSPYNYVLTVPNTDAANPALDDFYATTTRGSVFRAKCESPLKIQASFFYNISASDTRNGAPQAC